jgi:hypothetical protein
MRIKAVAGCIGNAHKNLRRETATRHTIGGASTQMTQRPEQISGTVNVSAKSHRAEIGRQVKTKAISEGKRFLIMFAYLWVMFGLFVLYESIVLAKHGINFEFHGFALINALVLAKIMLIAEDLHLGRGLKAGPLIYRVLFQSALFAIVLMTSKILEEILGGMLHGKAFSESISAFGAGDLQRIIYVTLIMCVALMPFFAYQEIGRAIGEDRLHALMFRGKMETGPSEAHP